MSNVRNQRVFVTVTSSTKFRPGIAQDHLHHISTRSASGSSSGITRVVTSPLTSKSGLRPRFFRLISGSLRWRAYLSTLDSPPPGGRPVLKNQSGTSWGQRAGQNHITSAVVSIVEILEAWFARSDSSCAADAHPRASPASGSDGRPSLGTLNVRRIKKGSQHAPILGDELPAPRRRTGNLPEGPRRARPTQTIGRRADEAPPRTAAGGTQP